MLGTEDITRLTKYQIAVFKDVFFTKEDGQKLEAKVDIVQNSIDAILKDKQTRDQEVTVLNHRMKETEDFLDKAAPKLGLEFKY